MAKGASISGFPEWLPQERAVELKIIDTLREIFELHGFLGIETSAVEMGSSLLKKGETSKEIYLLSRLQEVGAENDTPVEERLGLHFDLTVPLSRYVVDNAHNLTFPFKRWQIQKVWRGERPQEGRYREFVQADIDVVAQGELPSHYEVDVPLIMVEALEKLREIGVPKATVHANNRKLSEGFYRLLGLTNVDDVLHQIDKIDKVGADEVARLLRDECGADERQAQACLDLCQLSAANGRELRQLFDDLCARYDLDTTSEAYEFAIDGLTTLAMIIDEADEIRPGAVIADLKIARGLDYYTGSVYETFLEGAQSLGSICSGGRYDNLVSQGSRKYPGVGLSIGLSRLLSYILHEVHANASRVSPATVLVAVWDEKSRKVSNDIARQLRSRGIATDVAPTSAKLGKQIKYADNLGIPYVWIPGYRDDNGQLATDSVGDEVKNIVTGAQQQAQADAWQPEEQYASRTIVVGE